MTKKSSPPLTNGRVMPSGLSAPAQRALAAAGITRLEQFTTISEAELMNLHGMGPKAIETIKQSLRENGLAFAKAKQSSKISEQANQRIKRREAK